MTGAEDAGRALALIAAPLGEPGSGRVRYGAAMALYQAGRIGAGALEIYRICANLDGQDPAALLAEAGHALPTDGGAAIIALLEEADRYLAALHGPGVAEVRAGIAAARGRAARACPPAAMAVLDAWLEPALGPLSQSHAALAGAIRAAAPFLRWVSYDEYPRDQIGEAFAAGHAFASVIGGDSAVAADDYDFGLFLIAPQVLYRDHCHPAPELYAPLTGPHGWRFGPGMPLVMKPAHEPVWNDPGRPHLTKVGAVPFLCLYGWTGDVNAPAQVVPAADWAEMEALRL